MQEQSGNDQAARSDNSLHARICDRVEVVAAGLPGDVRDDIRAVAIASVAPEDAEAKLQASGTVINIVALREAILGGQCTGDKPFIRRWRLKKLVNENKWARIGFIFGFKPAYMTIGTSTVFDWNSCNQTFWDVFNEPVDEKSKKFVPVWSRSEQAFSEKTPRKRPATHRERLYAAQMGICFYCKRPTPISKFTQDHVVPRALGGTNKFTNKVGSCSSCNNAKGIMSQAEFLASPYLATKLKLNVDR